MGFYTVRSWAVTEFQGKNLAVQNIRQFLPVYVRNRLAITLASIWGSFLQFTVRFQNIETAFLDVVSRFLDTHCGTSTHPASPISQVHQETQGDAASVFLNSYKTALYTHG
jgi:hypothetical protein